MKKLITLIFSAGLFTIIMITSCKSPTEKTEGLSEPLQDTLTSKQLEYILPSPAEVLSMTQDLGLKFDMNLLNPIKSTMEFTLFRNQALNLGVYISDFSYLLLFEKQPESIKYLYHIQDMSTLLGVQEYFNDEFFNNILSNLNKPDTLKELALDQTALFFNRMEKVGNKDLALLVTTGAMIEVVFLSSEIINENLIDDNTISAVTNLAILFDNFHLHYTVSNYNKESNEKLSNDLKEIRNIFTSMSIKQTSNAIRKDGKLIVTSESQNDITTFNINKLKVMVGKVRAKIVNQEY